MSRYLIDRIDATPNIELHPHTQLTHSSTASRRCAPEAVTWRQHTDRSRGAATDTPRVPVRRRRPGDRLARRLRRGARPAGLRAHRSAPVRSLASAVSPAPLASNAPGVFAVGDVRSGSVKRVGGAIGEGAAVVALIHLAVTN